MSARQRIESAENAILFAKQRALSERSDPDHAAAVELESRGLLTDRQELVREIRAELAAEIEAAVEERAGGSRVWTQFQHGMREAMRIVRDGRPDEPSPVSVPPRAGERAAWRMARGESAVNQEPSVSDPTDPAGAA